MAKAAKKKSAKKAATKAASKKVADFHGSHPRFLSRSRLDLLKRTGGTAQQPADPAGGSDRGPLRLPRL